MLRSVWRVRRGAAVAVGAVYVSLGALWVAVSLGGYLVAAAVEPGPLAWAVGTLAALGSGLVLRKALPVLRHKLYRLWSSP